MTEVDGNHQTAIVRALKYHRDHQDDVPEDYVKTKQTEISTGMRETVAEWLLAVCEEEQCQPHLFCLTINCLDRVLSKISIKGSQLQLLASACLLVSWKIREHSAISAAKIVKYTNYNVKLEELLEWEVYVLSKLNWNISSVVAIDFVDHIIQNVGRLQTEIVFDMMTRSRIQSLIYQSHISYKVARYPPSVIAAAAVLVGVRPCVDMPPPRVETPSPSLSSSCTSSPELSRLTPSSSSSCSRRSPFRVNESPIARSGDSPSITNVDVRSPDVVISRTSDMDKLTRSVQRITFVDKTELSRCSDQLQHVSHVSRHVPPSPSPDLGYSDTSSTGSRFSTSSPLPVSARSLFKDLETVKTPTKILDAATSIHKNLIH